MKEPQKKLTKEELAAMVAQEQQKDAEAFSKDFEALVAKYGFTFAPSIQIVGQQINASLVIVPLQK